MPGNDSKTRHARWRRALLAALACACLVHANASEAPGDRWRLEIKSERHSDPVPLRALGDDEWIKVATPRPGRNLAYAEDEVRLSRRLSGWSFGLLARHSATVVMSRDTIDLAGQIARGERPANDRRWDTFARMRGFTGFGGELRRDFSLGPQWKAGWAIQGLVLTRWRQRWLDGPANYDAASASYDFALQYRQVDNRLKFPFQQSFAGQGAGLLLAGELGWEGEQAFASVSVRDGGWLRWSRIPEQQMQLNTNTRTFDADGFLVYQPLVQGRNSQSGGTRSLPWRTTLQAGWRFEGSKVLSAGVDFLPGFGALPRVQWQQRVGDIDWELGWRFHERRATVAAAWKGWRVHVGADALGRTMRSREFGISYTLLR